MLKNLPNILTYTRLVCAVLLLIVLALNPSNKALLFYLFAIGGVTDWLDGYIAKNYQLVSRIGEIIDPIADKALVICALLVLVHYDSSIILLIASAIIILREFIISALRQILTDLPNNPLKVNFLSRVKALVQMFGIGTCMFSLEFGNQLLYQCGIGLIAISALLTIGTFVTYLMKIKPILARI